MVTAEYIAQWRREHPGYNAQQQKNWRKKYPERARASHQTWRAQNKEKTHAHLSVQDAIRSGKVKRKPCIICGNPNSQGHHEDYSKRLDVVWLCALHHKKLHAKQLSLLCSH